MSTGEVVHCNGGENILTEKRFVQFVIHNFASLPHKKNDSFKTPVVMCHGQEWYIKVYPGGKLSSREDDTYVTVLLHCHSGSNENIVSAKYQLAIPSAGITRSSSTPKIFDGQVKGKGWPNFVTRRRVLDSLDDGKLTIVAYIQVYVNKKPIWSPKNNIGLDMLKLLESPDGADVIFRVEKEDFHLHRSVLKCRIPVLEALADSVSKEEPVNIGGCSLSSFRALIHFGYSGQLLKTVDFSKEAWTLLEVADKFGCTSLKLAAETELVRSAISVDTAADLILLADAKNCALLKEAAMAFFAANSRSVMSSAGWERVKESASILSELMELAFGAKRIGSDNSTDRDFKRMCVADLRCSLDARGLEVDGSRDMLVNRLEAAAIGDSCVGNAFV